MSHKLTGRDYVRELVRQRDKHTCQDCKRKWRKGERRFDTHHIKGLCGKKSRGYDSVDEIDILITLCHRCHYNRPEHASKHKKRPKGEDKASRNKDIVHKHYNGVPRKVLADEHNLSEIMIYKIIRHYGATEND